MKKSEFKKFIREEIVNTLNEDESADLAAKTAKKSAIDKEVIALQKRKQELGETTDENLDTSKFIEPKEMENTLEKIYHIISGNRGDYLNIGDDVIKCLKQFDKTKYSVNELARLATVITIGDKAKAAEAKKLNAGKWKADLIDIIEKSGEKGITQVDLATALGKESQQSINPTVREFISLGIITKGETPIPASATVKEPKKPKKEKTAPKPYKQAAGFEEKPETEEDDEPEIEDTYHKPSEEDKEDKDAEPSVSAIKAVEKNLSKSGGVNNAKKLSPEDEATFTRIKSGIIKKMDKIKKLPKTQRSQSDDYKVLQKLLKRDDIQKLFRAKGVSMRDLVSSGL